MRAYASAAAACSAALRLGPTPDADTPRDATRHSTVNDWACASPAVSTTTYSGTGMRRPCSHSWRRVFGSLPSVAGLRARKVRRVDATDHGERRVEAAIEKDGAEHRFERIGDDRRAVSATALLLAFAEAQRGAQIERPREPRERVALDEMGADPRQVAFGYLREAVIEKESDHAVQHRVADEFEPLVVNGAVAAVRQRLVQQIAIAKRVTQPCGKRRRRRGPVHSVRWRRRGRLQRSALASNSISRLTLLTRWQLARPRDRADVRVADPRQHDVAASHRFDVSGIGPPLEAPAQFPRRVAGSWISESVSFSALSTEKYSMYAGSTRNPTTVTTTATATTNRKLTIVNPDCGRIVRMDLPG